MNKELNNNEGERDAKDYVDTTLRSSHYNQTQRIEDASDGHTNKLGTIEKIVLSSLICIILTFFISGYVFIKHGSFLTSGDSIEGLREHIKTSEANASQRYEANRLVAKHHRENRNAVEGELRDQIDKLHVELDVAQKQKRFLASELNKEKNYRIRIEQQIAGLQRQLATLVDIVRSNDEEEVASKKNLGKSAMLNLK